MAKYVPPKPAAPSAAPAPTPTPVEPADSGLFTAIRVNILPEVDGQKVKALCSFKVADAFFVTGVKIVEGSKGLFMAMPSYKNAKGDYQDVAFPASKSWRDELSGLLLYAYHAADRIPR